MKKRTVFMITAALAAAFLLITMLGGCGRQHQAEKKLSIEGTW